MKKGEKRKTRDESYDYGFGFLISTSKGRGGDLR
jgi:hypothetical protein